MILKKYDLLSELSEVVASADGVGVPDSDIVKSLIFVSVEETFRRASSDEAAILAITSALNVKLCDKLGLHDWGFSTHDSEGSKGGVQ
jgi:hypothetical protein